MLTKTAVNRHSRLLLNGNLLKNNHKPEATTSGINIILMTKEAFAAAATVAMNSKTKAYPQVVEALVTAMNMTPAKIASKMQPEELQQHLINLSWEIYQKDTGIT